MEKKQTIVKESSPVKGESASYAKFFKELDKLNLTYKRKQFSPDTKKAIVSLVEKYNAFPACKWGLRVRGHFIRGDVLKKWMAGKGLGDINHPRNTKYDAVLLRGLEEGKTLDEIGKELGVTREWVRQLYLQMGIIKGVERTVRRVTRREELLEELRNKLKATGETGTLHDLSLATRMVLFQLCQEHSPLLVHEAARTVGIQVAPQTLGRMAAGRVPTLWKPTAVHYKIKALQDLGKTYTQIADQLGCSEALVGLKLKELEVGMPRYQYYRLKKEGKLSERQRDVPSVQQ